MVRKLLAAFFLITCLTVGIPLFAHHGTAGVYYFTHRITTKATVTEYIWANPHVQIYFKLKNDKGDEQTWGVETASPGNMLASGWTKNTFKPGDQISVSFVPAKNEAHGDLELRSRQKRQGFRDLSALRASRWAGSRKQPV